MVRLVTEAEKQREQDLHDKTVLLREVHHRVKNNLQLIASIMNMHGRTAQTPEARRLLSQLQRRVRGLSSVHHTLNATSRMTTVNTRTMIEHLVQELGPGMPVKGQMVQVETDIASIELGQDQSVTLSMLVAEAITNSVKYVGVPKNGKPRITVALGRTSDGRLRFRLWNTRGDRDEAVDEPTRPGGIGRRLMQAFVAQLDGDAREVVEEDCFLYEVLFTPADRDPEEPRAFRAMPGG